jgi:hypothetical protein
MIAYLKNSAFRTWCAGLVAFAVSLGLLANTSGTVSFTKHMVMFGAWFAAAYAGIGWIADYMVRIQFDPLLQEAGILERDGNIVEAEKAYARLLALLDSFLVSPRRRGHYLQILGARLARFYAAQAEKSSLALRWITRYLSANPGDRAIAEAWLQDMERLADWHRSQQELAARIGETLRHDGRIQRILARHYIRSGRTDFTALQTYRRIMADQDEDASAMAYDLANLFLREGRADELALKAYVNATHQQKPSEGLRRGLAACLRWTKVSTRNRDLIAQARQVVGAIPDGGLERMASGFLPPARHLRQTTDVARPTGMFRSLTGPTARKVAGWGHRMREGLHRAVKGLRSPRLLRGLQVGLISALTLVAVALLFNTAGHLVPPPPPPAVSPPAIAVNIEPTPFTLQVAAYLKPVHAERYLTTLREKGQDAYRVEAQSQQKTWYQVRVGHFPTKAAARTYGQQLKADGIIEDYYVANYEKP